MGWPDKRLWQLLCALRCWTQSPLMTFLYTKQYRQRFYANTCQGMGRKLINLPCSNFKWIFKYKKGPKVYEFHSHYLQLLVLSTKCVASLYLGAGKPKFIIACVLIQLQIRFRKIRLNLNKNISTNIIMKCGGRSCIASHGSHWNYRKPSNISRTLASNTIVDNSDVVGASPVGAAPTTSSLST